MLTHTVEERKSLGVYYTPNNLSKVLCDWAIRHPSEAVLEPSFGGCGFLEASINRFRELGSENPEVNIYGADVDKRAFNFLYDKIGRHTQINKRFIHDDFIKLKKEDFSREEFDVLIGNPPYVSVHNMTDSQRGSCKLVLGESTFSESTLGSNANLWAFFLVHSLNFLSDGGRMAWVLPSSALHADYAKRLIKLLESHFSKLNLVRLSERLFKEVGADEVSVILFAEGFKKDKGEELRQTNYHTASSVVQLNRLITSENWERRGLKNYKACFIGRNTMEAFNTLAASSASSNLGDFCDVKIGLVTGANKLFTLRYKDAVKHGINYQQLKPIITKFSQLLGLEHSFEAHKKLKKGDSKALLLCPKKLVPGSPAEKYLRRITDEEIASNRTFNKRADWFYPNDNNEPDAFLTYMFDKVAKFVLNKGKKVNCTNSIHRVYFKKNLPDGYARAISISMLSSFSRLSVELNGRAYGSGVQKLEPTAAKNTNLLINARLVEAFNQNWYRLNKLVMKGAVEQVTSEIDAIIAANCSFISITTLENMRKAAHMLRTCRYEMKQEKKL